MAQKKRGLFGEMVEGMKYAAKTALGSTDKSSAKPKQEQVGAKQGKEAMSAIEARKKVLQQAASPDSYKKGGKVKKGGMAKVHTGERVLNTKQTKKLEKKPALMIAIGVAKPKAAPRKKK